VGAVEALGSAYTMPSPPFLSSSCPSVPLLPFSSEPETLNTHPTKLF
jgi:hypothetical protein